MPPKYSALGTTAVMVLIGSTQVQKYELSNVATVKEVSTQRQGLSRVELSMEPVVLTEREMQRLREITKSGAAKPRIETFEWDG